MADRDEIIRRIISGDMSRGGADFAARMMQQRVTPEDLLAQYPATPAPQPTFGFGGMMPKQATLDRIQANADAQMAAQRAGLEAQPAFGFGGMMPKQATLDRIQARADAQMNPPPPEAPVDLGAFAQDYNWQPEGPNPSIGERLRGTGERLRGGAETLYSSIGEGVRGGAETIFGEEAIQRAMREEAPAALGATIPSVPGFEFMSGGIGMPEGMDPLGMPEIGMGGAAMVPAMLDGGPTGTPLASPQAGLPTPPGPMTLPAATPPGVGVTNGVSTGGAGGVSTGGTGGSGGIDMASLPSAADVSPSNPAAYNPETGTRPAEARALSIWDRMFGEPGTDRRSAMSQALMQMGAVMMSTNGNLGQALGAGIQAGLLEYDQTMQALADEAMEAKKMGMEEEAHELNMALKELQLARAQSGGGGGGGGGGVGARTSGVVENPLDAYRENVMLLESLGYTLTPEQRTAGAAEALGIDLPASAYTAPRVNPMDQFMADFATP